VRRYLEPVDVGSFRFRIKGFVECSFCQPRDFAMERFCSGIPVVSLFSTLASSQTSESEPKPRHTPIVEDLVRLLEVRPPVREALGSQLRNAGLAGLENTEAFLDHLDDLVTTPPVVA